MSVKRPWAVTEAQIIAWVGGQDWRRETRRSTYASLRGFWAWGVRVGRCAVSPAASLPSVRPEQPCPRPTPDRMYRDALARADRRERLILMLAATAGHLSAQRVGNLASRLLPEGWTLHTLRHRCATKVDEAAGLIAAQRILGHASVATTQRYVPASDEALRRAIRHAAA